MESKQIFTVDEANFPLKSFSELLKRVRYIPLIDAGVSLRTHGAIARGKEMDVFVKLNGVDYVADVWPGAVHFVDFLHPNATKYWI
jgi:alpha-glucosidase (family GH31 glycosyl hydrolase)